MVGTARLVPVDQSVHCVITHPVTAVSGSPPSLYLSPPRFCLGDVNRLLSLDGESPYSVAVLYLQNYTLRKLIL